MKTKRRILLAIISFCLMLSMMPIIPVSAETDTDTWDGTADMSWIDEAGSTDSGVNSTPLNGKYYKVTGYASDTIFTIDTAEKLAGVAALFNVEDHRSKNWFVGCTFLITKNLDLQGSQGEIWKPIGDETSKCFSATLEGSLNGTGESITITNMNMVGADNTGLVGTQKGGGIKNITITDSKIDVTDKSGDYSMGSFVGYLCDSAATFENLKSDATLIGNASSQNNHPVGGIVAYNNIAATFNNCEFTGTITNYGKMSGGIVGCSKKATTITNCRVNTKIDAFRSTDTSNCHVGGIIGQVDASEVISISNCSVAGTLNGQYGYTGGIVGRASGGSCTLYIDSCSSSATVVAENTSTVGGVVGYKSALGTIKNCTVTGSITNSGNNTGGVIGYADAETAVSDCYVNANVTATNGSDCNLGGIIGKIVASKKTITITNCVVSGTLDGHQGCTGGIIGNCNNGEVTVSSCYSDAAVSAHTASGRAAGGFIGYIPTSATLKISNCQFEGTVEAEKTGLGIGNCNNSTAVTFDICVSTTKSGAWYDATSAGKPSTAGCYDMDQEKPTNLSVDYWTTFNGKSALRVAVPALMKVADTSVNTNTITFKDAQQKDTSVRIISEINGLDYDAVYFDMHVTKKDSTGITYSKAVQRSTKVCYTSYLNGDETVAATTGKYFVVFEITGLTAGEYTINCSAHTKSGDTLTYASAAPYNASFVVSGSST